MESSFIVNFAKQFSIDVTLTESTSRKNITSFISHHDKPSIFMMFKLLDIICIKHVLFILILFLILVLLVLQEYVKSKALSGRGPDGSVIWLCTECEYQHKKNSNVFRHIQRKHLTYCVSCWTIFQSEVELKEHKNICHRPW